MVRTPSDLLRQREHRQRTAQLSVIAELLVAAHGTEAVGVLLEPRGHADAGPAADARKDPDVLLALMLIGEDVADDAGRRLELEQFLVDVVRVDALEITLQCAIARDATRGHEDAAPDRELLGFGLDDLPAPRVPRHEVAHVRSARRRIHRQRCAYIR